jgi:hypothetical protein
MLEQPALFPIFDEGRESWQLAREYCVSSLGYRVCIPAGYISDGASVPRALWWYAPPVGLYSAAALCHDWLYANKGVRPMLAPPVLSRATCDAIFRNLMLRAGVRPGKARAMWLAVRSFGWAPWNRAEGPRVEEPRYVMNEPQDEGRA